MAFKGARAAFFGLRNSMHASPMMKIALTGVLLIPVIFSGFYLSAFFDPYSNLSNVAVAVVNEDKGAEISGEQRNLGDELCNKLDEEDQKFGWTYVSADEAQAGLESGDYYMACIIPANFSESVASAQGTDPDVAKLHVEYNRSKNMLASQIGGTAWAKVQSALNQTIVEEYWNTAFDQLKDSGIELQTAADGAVTLEEGLESATSGADQLADGAQSAQDGSSQLDQGLASAAEGSSALDEGLGQAETGSQQVAQGASDLSSGADELSSGMSTLSDGASSLEQGASSLSGGLDSLATNSAKMLKGIGNLQAGVSDYTAAVGSAVGQLPASSDIKDLTTAASNASSQAAGLSRSLDALASSTDKEGNIVIDAATFAKLQAQAQAASQLSAGTSSGVSNLASGMSQISGQVSQLQKASDQLNSGASSLVENYEALHQGILSAQGGASSLNEGAQQLSGGVSSAAAGSATVAQGAAQLSTGASDLSAGVSAAKEGSADLTEGLDRLKAGSSALDQGLVTLADGAGSLADGLMSAKDGAGELATGISSGADQLKESGSNAEERSVDMSQPVELVETDYTHVENYGTGFAPFFIGLGIWVGCIFALFLFKPLNRRLMISGADPARVAFSGLIPISVYGIIQGIISAAFVQFFLGAHVENMAAYYGITILCSVCFMAIMQFLVAAFKFPGRFISVVLLTLQLTSAAGTFPVETAPTLFQWLNPFMPMTYYVDGMRIFMTGGNAAAASTDVLALVAFTLIAFVCTCIYAYRKRTVKETDIHPLLEL